MSEDQSVLREDIHSLRHIVPKIPITISSTLILFQSANICYISIPVHVSISLHWYRCSM